MSIPIADKDPTGWSYERTCTRAFPEIIISEGPLDEAVQALICRHCGYHRVKLVGWGSELSYCRIPSVMGMGGSDGEPVCGEQIEVLIFKCLSCGKTMKIGADDSRGLLSRISEVIEEEIDALAIVIGKLFPEEYKQIEGGKRVAEVATKLISKYHALIGMIKQVDREEKRND